jgi:segregation and condensation protein A
MDGQRDYILNQVNTKPRVSFSDIVEAFPTKIALIFNFLSVLELLALGQLSIQIGEGFNNFWIAKPESSEINSIL